ncbi:tricarballylate dehydrogenase [Actinomycetospora sp. NBRC 106375]|uniref:FAD-binding protein n=1 Tax=Actinomycetospora sp. NBRC 106375 TaxID=3032207 RepID=UPI0024A175C0|nr:FAD-binding protein [Actinomycetospora sp. NBRC 106375]GLZ49873.1 tricarballylate dehydrogenase [Actinomycetospora sp. NBRC 106375]
MAATEEYDLVVVGHGAAGLAAAVTYAEAREGARIAVLERAPREERGGATRWTGAFLRVAEDRTLDPDWTKRMQRVSAGLADDQYCRLLERETPTTMRFIEERGVKLLFDQFPFAHTLVGGPPAMRPAGRPDGGGKAIVEALSRILEGRSGVDLLYQTEAVRLTISEDGAVDGLMARGPDGLLRRLGARDVVLACGGFEGSSEMLSRYVGPKACDLRLIAPGVRNNRGDGLRMVTEIGGDTAGQFDMIHAEAVDTRTSAADAVIYGFAAGIFVNGNADRFFDEGRDTWDNTFEHIGFEIWRHQNQEAYWIADAKTLAVPGVEHSLLSDVPPERADTIGDLAAKLGIDSEALEKTVAGFNAACGSQEFDVHRLDGKSTIGVTPPKSNWATPLDTPPFIGIPLTSAITFTYGGVRTDLAARVVTPGDVTIPHLYAAGELTGLYYHEYPPGTSVLRSLTFGRLAAEHAAAHA